jgi:hypothetical protein
MGIPIFAIGGGEGESGNEQTLLGYTKDRARIWGNGKAEGEEHGRFNEAIEKVKQIRKGKDMEITYIINLFLGNCQVPN